MHKKTPTRRTPALKPMTAVTAAINPAATNPTAMTLTAAPVAAVTAPVEAVKSAVTPVATPAAASITAPVAAKAAPAPIASAFPADQVEKLQDASVEVAVDACEALAKSGDARAVAPLVAGLENRDGYCHVVTRAAAAMALGAFDDAKTNGSAIAALLVAAKDEMAEVSREAILALGRLKSTAAVATLTEIAANTSGFYVTVSRHAAVRSLGRLKATSAKSVLESIANDGNEDAALTAAAREAIAAM